MGLFDLFSNKTAENAARLANEGAAKGLRELGNYYEQGRGALTDQYGKAADVYTGLMDQYGQGAAAYGDVSGAHGVEGLQRGTDLFRNSGQYGVYGFANDQAQQALQRAGSAAGRLDSGNTNYGAMKTASDLAGQHWGQFQQGLQPYLGLQGNAGSGLAGVYTGLGGGLNQSYQGVGNAANASQTQQGQNLAGAEMNKYNVGANQLNAIMGGAQMLMGMPPSSFGKIGGGSGGGGSGGGGLASLFSGFGGSDYGSIPQTANLGTSFQGGQYIPTYY